MNAQPWGEPALGLSNLAPTPTAPVPSSSSASGSASSGSASSGSASSGSAAGVAPVAPPGGIVEVTLPPGRAQIILALVSGSLISLNLLVNLSSGLQLMPYAVTRFFDGNNRDSVLAGARTALALIIVVLAFACSAAARRSDPARARGWRLFAYAAVFTFVDESTFLRHSVARTVHDHYHPYGLWRFAWTVIYLPAAAAVLIALLRDLRPMTSAVRRRLLPGLAGFVVGALALEPFAESIADAHGGNSLGLKVVLAVADSVEFAGLTLVVCGLLVAAAGSAGGFTVRLASPMPRSIGRSS